MRQVQVCVKCFSHTRRIVDQRTGDCGKLQQPLIKTYVTSRHKVDYGCRRQVDGISNQKECDW